MKVYGLVLMNRIERKSFNYSEKQRRRYNKLVSINNRLFWKNTVRVTGSKSTIRKPRCRLLRSVSRN